MGVSILLVLMISVLLTSFLSGIFGMSGGLLLMGILSLLVPVELAMVIHGISQAAANGSRFLSLTKHVDWRASGFYLLGALVGVIVFWSFQFVPSKFVIFLLLGLMPFVSCLKWVPRLDFQKPSHAILSGFLNVSAHFMAGVSGPILDLFFVRSSYTRFQVIATKAFTQSISHVLKLIYFGSFLKEDAGSLSLPFCLAIVATAILGTLLGGLVLRRMNDENFRLYSRRIILTLGFVYLIKAGLEFLP